MVLGDVTVPSSVQAMAPAPHGESWPDWAKWAEQLPFSQQMGLRCQEVAMGRAVLFLEAPDWVLNPFGAVHGGIVVGCADHCFGVAAATVLDPARVAVTASLSSDFLRPAFPPITFETTVDRFGRNLAFVSVTVTDRHGRITNVVRGTMAMTAAPGVPQPD